MRITEIFCSIQGEGRGAGMRTLFIRTALCNLRCVWCDTKYSWNSGKFYHVDGIVKEVRKENARYVSITGGEPLIQKTEVIDLITKLSKIKNVREILIETNGSICIKPYLNFRKVTISLDVKCPSSGMVEHNHYKNLRLLRKKDSVKFVIGNEEDYNFFVDIISNYKIKAEITVQPVYGTDPKWIAEKILQDRFNVKFSMQIHKYIWGDLPGH